MPSRSLASPTPPTLLTVPARPELLRPPRATLPAPRSTSAAYAPPRIEYLKVQNFRSASQGMSLVLVD